MKPRLASFLVLLLLTVFLSSLFNLPPGHATTGPSGFTFAAAGDMGSLTGTGPAANSLRLLNIANPDFFLGLGDLSYNENVTGNIWCQQFKSSYNNIEVLPGEHDTGEGGVNDTSTTHDYNQFVANCPFSLQSPSSSTCFNETGSCFGEYGRQYYFDYPAISPLARFILISPGVYNLTGPPACIHRTCNAANNQTCIDMYGCWQYSWNDPHYNWTSTAIDGARNSGIKWVIVTMFKPCISAGKENCSIGKALINLLVADKVDLVLEAHDHVYERSKQLSLNANCLAIPYNTTATFVDYNADCVADDGSRGFYNPGVGTVINVLGTFGGGFNQLGTTSYNKAEEPYFASLMGAQTPGSGHGFTEFTVTSTKITVKTHFAGSFQDSYSIVPPPVPSFFWSPVNPQPGQNVTFTGSASGANGSYTLNWTFGDGSMDYGLTVFHSFLKNGMFNVTLVARDSSNNTGTTNSLIPVGSWNPFVECSPVQTSIEGVVGSITIQRVAGDPTTVGADYRGGGFQLAGNYPYDSNPTNWPFSKRALHPPCAANNSSTLVEIHEVSVRPISVGDCYTKYDVSNGGGSYPNGQDCSTLFNVDNPAYPNCPGCYMHRLYAVIDRDWVAAGVAPTIPEQNQTIDLQGFVYWNPQWANMSWHSYTGWEVHLVAWRLSSATYTHEGVSQWWYAVILAPVFAVMGLLVFKRARKRHGEPSNPSTGEVRVHFG